MKSIIIYLILLSAIIIIISSTSTSTSNNNIINEDDLVIKVNILNISSTSASLEYAIIPSESRDDDLLDIITNTNDLDLDYTIKSIYYTINSNPVVASKLSQRFKDQILITNLTSSSKYAILFTLEYDNRALNITNETIKSDLVLFYTHDSCNCKLNSTINNNECSSLNSSSGLLMKCQCKSCYEGTSCERCKAGCYLNHKTQECEQCPCDLSKSSGECLMIGRGQEEDYSIKCTLCKMPNMGLLCDQCDIYYYKSLKHNNQCLPCMCNDNTSPKQEHHCQDLTGDCINCINNSTGKNCELCIEGYVGSALNQTCISLNDSRRMMPSYRTTHMPLDYKNLFVLTVLIFAALFTILTIVYYCNKASSSSNYLYHQQQQSIFHPFSRLLANIKQRNGSKFNGMFTFKRRFMSSSGGGGGDDDLNLAENQIFDECLFTDDFYYANQPNNNKKSDETATNNNNNLLVVNNESTTQQQNPYCNLTVST